MVFSEEEITHLYRIYKTVLQMLRDRNYVISETEVNMTRQEFTSTFGDHMKREDLVISRSYKNNPDDKIFVFFVNDAKIGVKTIRDIIQRMLTENVFRGILICQSPLSHHGRAAVSEMASKCRLEVFLEDELLVNITMHYLVPPHQVLTDAEKKALLNKYTVKETQLPRILMTDPIAKYYGLRRGQVVRIIRPSETAGRYVTYRYVV
ncbi:unnamed protein product [Vicia faba]|uniref:DNA-directed RNA polymerases I, II, and III subunit RPABC1 n=1 Tax=Vicia faba TaxID=3906 RepID=A0AAV0Z8C4_VICFA|nr:unnamed protein product [Vicia faba]